MNKHSLYNENNKTLLIGRKENIKMRDALFFWMTVHIIKMTIILKSLYTLNKFQAQPTQIYIFFLKLETIVRSICCMKAKRASVS